MSQEEWRILGVRINWCTFVAQVPMMCNFQTCFSPQKLQTQFCWCLIKICVGKSNLHKNGLCYQEQLLKTILLYASLSLHLQSRCSSWKYTSMSSLILKPSENLADPSWANRHTMDWDLRKIYLKTKNCSDSTSLALGCAVSWISQGLKPALCTELSAPDAFMHNFTRGLRDPGYWL